MNDSYEQDHGVPLSEEKTEGEKTVHILPPSEAPSGYFPGTVAEAKQEVFVTPPPGGEIKAEMKTENVVGKQVVPEVIVTPPPAAAKAPVAMTKEVESEPAASVEGFRWEQSAKKTNVREPDDYIRNYRLGQPKPSKYNQPRKPAGLKGAGGDKNGMAIASLILGLLGLALLWVPYFAFVLPLLAVIFGVVGLAQATADDRLDSGRGMAIAGIVFGLIGLAVAALILSVFGCVFDWVRSTFKF
jgi:hypothetical protein